MSTNREIAERLGILICDYARDASLDGWMLNSQRKDGSFTNPNAERARQTIIVLEAAKAALAAATESGKAAVEKARREEWLDIRTAPKDGAHIQVVNVNDPNSIPATVHWFGPPDLPGLRAGGWYLSVNRFAEDAAYTWGPPTHWLPLHKPPRLTAQQGEAERPDTQEKGEG